MPPLRARLGPLLAALALTGVGYTALEISARTLSGRAFVYPLDDAYIHLAVARTLAEHGTWGVNPGEVASASSSPLWTLLLAGGFRLLGPWPLLPLLLNGIAAAGVLVGADTWLRAAGLGAGARILGLGLWVVAVPLPFLAGIGMEHVLQLLLALLLARAGPGAPLRLGVLAAALTLTRYESVVLPAALAVSALRARRLPDAAALLLGPALGVGIFGGLLWSAGGTFLPAGVLLKAAPGHALAGNLAEAPAVALLVVAVGLLGGPGRGVFVLAAAAQLVFGRVGWFYRYEAWLVGWGLLLLMTGRRPRLTLPLLLLALGPRTEEALRRYPYAARFMADTDFPLAEWLARDWAGASVGVHNLGVAAWQGRVRVVDVAGLGTADVARHIADHTLTPEVLGALLRERGVGFVVGSRSWRAGDTPPGVTELAAVWAPFPTPPGAFESTVIWIVDPGQSERIAASFATIPWSPRVRVARP